MDNYVGIHYSEIALKGGNRPYFEKKLKENIKKAVKNENYEKITRIHDRILIKLDKKSNKTRITDKLKKVFGISHVYIAFSCDKEVDLIIKKSKKLIIDKNKTFKVQSSRRDKNFTLNSLEINEKIGESLYNDGYKVDVKNPDTILFIDILDDIVLLYTEKIKCHGGLPVGSSGKALVLFSGGIDSPVASWEIMKRGCAPVYVHFHALQNNTKVESSKITRLIKTLTEYSNFSKLYIVPYDIFLVGFQGKNDMVIFRRFINRVAEQIAKEEDAKVLVTGESIGQVSSQTLENISVIEEVTKMPIIRPLITMNKDDIIRKAREINTFDDSIEEYKDCCSIVSREGKTKTKLKDVSYTEDKIDLDKMIKETLENTTTLDIRK